ncbi:MAG: efflux RND transporter permease subunit [Candidatus Krumholzibacteriota bacterium]|nr:efflux RND transporter permease subunit [Candidatus Krumholzibacteriota bacterium]
MNLFSIFIRRPVLTTMILILLVVMGIYSYQRLIIEMMPNIEFPLVLVTTIYPGASPSEVESQVTKKIEDEVATIANVKNLNSISMENVSQVIIEFELETDVDLDAIDVKDKIDAIRSELPEDAELPVISKFDINAFPVMELAVSAPRSLEEVYHIADKVIGERLSRIGGVAEVTITGKREREIRIEVAPERLRAYGLSILDIVGIVSLENLNIPSGQITRGASETTIRMVGELKSTAELADLRLPLPAGGTIPLSEVADIRDTTEELRESSSYNGEPVIGLSINKRSDGNTVLVANGVYKALEELRAILDEDIEITITSNAASFVFNAVNDVLSNIAIGIVLTSILLFVFLHDWRQTLIAVISMPVSVIATFLLIERAGFSINVMTLMALGISIGTLVTNSIVVIENITRLVKEGMNPFEAAEKGTSQVAIAVIASTLTNIVVFTPIAFMTGIIGRFFLQFGVTVVFATLFSLLISFTMVPMLSARLLRAKAGAHHHEESLWIRFTTTWDDFYLRLSGGYRSTLAYILGHRWLPLTITIVIFFFALFLFVFVGGEFMPVVDQNIAVISLELPEGTSIEKTREVAGKVDRMMRERPEVEGVIVKIGGGQRGVGDAEITLILVDAAKRGIKILDFVNEIRPSLAAIPDAEIMVTLSGEGGSSEADLLIEVLSSDPEKLSRVGGQVFEIVNQVPGLVEVQSSEETGKPEVSIRPRRRQLAWRGLSVASVGSMLRAAYEGQEAGVYRELGEEYDIMVRYAEKDRNDPAYLEDLPIKMPSGSVVPLADIATLERTRGDARILHRDKQRCLEITANVSSGSISEARRIIDRRLEELDIPSGVIVKYGGMAEIQDESFASIQTAMILAILLVYIVMAAILESFIHPLTVMITLPLGLIGASVGLFFTGQTINIMSLMAMIMLVGIVVNNAILLLDYTSQLRAQGHTLTEALLEACPTRLRPIIMANLAIAVGMVPQALGGAGSEYRVPMAVVQMGGVLLSAVFTLFIIPVIYSGMDRLTFAGRRERKRALSGGK